MMKLLTALVLIEALLLIWVFAVEPRLLRVSRYQLEAPDMKGLKMVFASDFHLTPGSKERLRKIVAAINAEKPDIVLLGGDFAKGHLRSVSMPAEEIAAGLAEIKAPAGVFAVLGNHDEWYGKKEMAAALAARGIMVLQNDGRQIDYQGISFYLGGVEDVSTGRPDVGRALSGAVGAEVLLSHSPDVFPEVPAQTVLTLAGHTHSGQVYVPGFGAPIANSRYGQKYLRGLKEENGRRLITSVGLGTSILPVRFCSVPEIVSIEWR